MDESDDLEAFDAQVAALESSLQGTRETAAVFDAELSALQSSFTSASADAQGLSRSISRGLRKSFEDLIFDGAALSDVMNSLAESITRSIYAAAVQPVYDQVGSLVTSGLEGLLSSFSLFEKGAPFSQGRVVPFATGGIVSGPVQFPMRGGTGLMGEAGPEAIMPLTRGADGRLGVQAQGGGRSVAMTFNISTPDVAGFERSQSQIAAQMSRALGRADRNR